MRNVPEWTKGNAFAKRFFKWLRRKNKPALLTWENVFTKTFNREFTFVYMGTNLENRASHLYQGMEFVGIFNQKTFEFTDVSYALRALLNIPEGKISGSSVDVCAAWNRRFRNMPKRNWRKEKRIL